MSIKYLADNISRYGRHGDDQLMHVSRDEVAGLQALATRMGTSLTVNPDTGLTEAFSLKSLLPAIAGGLLTLIPGVGPLAAAAMVGGGTGLVTGSLEEGLLAGLGAYGGAGLGEGLAGAGANAKVASAIQGATSGTAESFAQPIASSFGQGAANAGVGLNNLGTKAGWEGLSSAMGGAGSAVKSGLAAAAPLVGEYEDTNNVGNMSGGEPPMYRQYNFNRKKGPFGPPGAFTGEKKWFEDTYTPYEPSTTYKGYAPGGPVESDPYYTMTGASGDAFKYLMGQAPASTPAQANPRGAASPAPAPAAAPVTPATPAAGIAAYLASLTSGAGGGYTYDPATQTYSGQGFNMGDWSSFLPFAGGGAVAGKLVTGPGDGVSDGIPAVVDGKTPAAMASGEFVLPARAVAEIGNGSTEAGAQRLYAMLQRIEQRAKQVQRGNDSGAWRELPA